MRNIFISVLLISLCVDLLAQGDNLNPTVQVTNAYENCLKDMNRPEVPVLVPDSLYKFDLDFDYMGFEKPYGGKEDFNPFLTDLDIASRRSQIKFFRMRLGAGYTLHPVLDLDWTFAQKGRFKAGIYAANRSYFGDYWSVVPDVDGNLQDNGNSGFGFNSFSRGGFDARVDWNACRLLLNANYDGVHSRTPEAVGNFSGTQRLYDAASFTLDFASTPDMKKDYWRYAFKAGYVFSNDNLQYSGGSSDRLMEHKVDLELMVAYDFASGHGVEVDADATATIADPYDAAVVTVRPKYMFSCNRFTIAVGVGMLFDGARNADRGDSPFSVFPSLRMEWNAVPKWMDIFVDADISGSMYDRRAQALKDGFYIPDVMPSIVKNRTVDAGLRGSLFDKLQYKLTAALDLVENKPLYSVRDVSGVPALSIVHDNLNNGRFELELLGKFGGFGIGAGVSYLLYINPNEHSILPPNLKANIDMRYNICSRIIPYIGLKFQNSSVSNGYTIPYFFNLYAGLEYRINRVFGIFIDGSNLLNQRCQYIPLVAERGVAVTGGIMLNF